MAVRRASRSGAILAAALALCWLDRAGGEPKAESPLEGKWDIVFYVQDYNHKAKSDGGKLVPITPAMALTVRGKAFEVTSAGGSAAWTIERVASADVKVFEVDLADEVAKVRSKASAKLDGDVLQVKIPLGPAGRSKELTLKPGEAGILIGARRAKE